MAPLCLAGWLVLLAGCHRQPSHEVGQVEVKGATVADNALLGMDAAQVEQALRKALVDEGHFHLLAPSEANAKDAVRLSLELPFTREAERQGRPGLFAEVGAQLTLRRRTEDGTARYEVVGLGEVPVKGEGHHPEQMRKALQSALAQAVSSAHLQLWAIDKTDAELITQLHDRDARMSEFALRVLAERKNPAVVEVLLQRLRGDDLDDAREAMGMLAELRELRAVRPLIDLAQRKDPSFVREVVFALAQIGGDEAQAYLYTLSEGHDDPEVRGAAQQALSELRHSTAPTKAAPAAEVHP